MDTKKQRAVRVAAMMGALSLWSMAMPAQAALSGYYDSLEQIQAVVQDARVGNALKQLPISHIESQAGAPGDTTRQWRVRSQDCELTILLEAKPPNGPGKTTYAVKQVSACR